MFENISITFEHVLIHAWERSCFLHQTLKERKVFLAFSYNAWPLERLFVGKGNEHLHPDEETNFWEKIWIPWQEKNGNNLDWKRWRRWTYFVLEHFDVHEKNTCKNLWRMQTDWSHILGARIFKFTITILILL